MSDLDKVPPYPGLVIVDGSTEYLLIERCENKGPDGWVLQQVGGAARHTSIILFTDRTRSGKQIVTAERHKPTQFKTQYNWAALEDHVLAPINIDLWLAEDED